MKPVFYTKHEDKRKILSTEFKNSGGSRSEATERQLTAFQLIQEKGMSIPDAMKAAGYAESTADNHSQSLVGSNAWKHLMEQYIPDRVLAMKHSALLEAKTDSGNMDTTAVARGLDMGYKLKGHYAPLETRSLSVELRGDLPSQKEALKLAEEYEENLRKHLV